MNEHGHPIARLSNVTLTYHNKRALDSITLDIPSGCMVGLIGSDGVGKSSLLNAIDTNLHLRVGAVSEDNEKGRHTTTTARLLPIGRGAFVVGERLAPDQAGDWLPAQSRLSDLDDASPDGYDDGPPKMADVELCADNPNPLIAHCDDERTTNVLGDIEACLPLAEGDLTGAPAKPHR